MNRELKDKLLAALDTSLDGLEDWILVDLLLEQLKQAKTQIFEAQQALIKEGLLVNHLRKELADVNHRAHTDPLFAAHGDFYFKDTVYNIAYTVSIGGTNNIRMFKHSGGFDLVLMQLRPDEFHALTKEPTS